MWLKQKIKSNQGLTRLASTLLHSADDPRPRWWVRNFLIPISMKKGSKAIIRSHVRLDTFPYNKFWIGDKSIIEDFSIINNGVGDVTIGNESMIGIGSVVIGPVKVGNNVMLAQHVVLSGLNHGYEDVNISPSKQPVKVKQIEISDNVWIGSNAVVTSGISIGKHSVVAAGSIVTKDVPEYCVVAGNPAKIIKKYNHELNVWEKVI